jgi:hypothetical protein
LFASGQSVDQQDLLIYDQAVDQVNDVQAVQLALHQRWQTKRGGPDNWHSVDFLTWNTDATFYANKPAAAVLDPQDFRGMFFPSAPETSIPRDALNTDLTWRASESTAVLADAQENLDERNLATASAGIAMQRGDRTTMYIGNRYIHSSDAAPSLVDPTAPPQDVDSNIVSFLANYELSTRYILGFGESYDYGSPAQDVSSSVSVLRRFDAFYVVVSLRYDNTTGDRGIFFGIRPNYLAPGPGSNMIPTVFTNQ